MFIRHERLRPAWGDDGGNGYVADMMNDQDFEAERQHVLTVGGDLVSALMQGRFFSARSDAERLLSLLNYLTDDLLERKE